MELIFCPSDSQWLLCLIVFELIDDVYLDFQWVSG
jgi:hypothetical protein